MKGILRRAFSLVRGGWKTLFLFEILFRLFAAFIVFPACQWLFNSCLRWTGLNYLTAENLGRFLTDPLMLACSAAILVAFALTTTIEVTGLVTCLHAAELHGTPTIVQLIREGLRDAARILRPRNLLLLLFMAFLVPIAQLPTNTSPLRLIHLPWRALAEYALSFPYVFAVAAYLAAALAAVGLAMCAFQYYALENRDAGPAVRKALGMSRGVRLRGLCGLIAWVAVVCAAVFGGSALLTAGLEALIGWIADDLNAQYRIMLPFNIVLSFVKSALPSVAAYAYISAVYYCRKARMGEPVPAQTLPVRKNARRMNAVTFYAVAALCVAAVVLYDTALRPALVRMNALEYVAGSSTLVVAHRGYTEEADENTITAFRAAIDLGVDYVELDVQQTADGVVVVTHDNTFRRVFGVDRFVWEMNYEEVRELSSPLTGECPPTLYEVLTLCDPTANFLIELKNNGHNPDLASAVYEILAECQCLDRCAIQSPSYRMLREFKQLSPDTRCGYILSFALGEYATLSAADFFSIDYDFTNESVVNMLHRQDKDVFVWTVNDEARMERLISLGVDGIITDNAPLAKTLLLATDVSPLDEILAEPLEAVVAPVPTPDPAG